MRRLQRYKTPTCLNWMSSCSRLLFIKKEKKMVACIKCGEQIICSKQGCYCKGCTPKDKRAIYENGHSKDHGD